MIVNVIVTVNVIVIVIVIIYYLVVVVVVMMNTRARELIHNCKSYPHIHKNLWAK